MNGTHTPRLRSALAVAALALAVAAPAARAQEIHGFVEALGGGRKGKGSDHGVPAMITRGSPESGVRSLESGLQTSEPSGSPWSGAPA